MQRPFVISILVLGAGCPSPSALELYTSRYSHRFSRMGATLVTPSLDVRRVPRWTARTAYPRGLLRIEGRTRLEVYHDIQEILSRSGFYSYAVYALTEGGFAVVTPVERIKRDGRSFSGRRRFDLRLPRCSGAACLVLGQKSWYRAFIITVNNSPLTVEREHTPLVGLIQQLSKYGPAHIRQGRGFRVNDELTANDKAFVHIYEFERRSTSDRTITWLESPRLNAPTHLLGAGLVRWSERQHLVNP